MTRENIMDAMNGIGEHLIVEAAEKLGFLNGSAVVVKAERRKGPSAFSRFMNSGWGVAAVCALVAVSVMGGIIWAGNQPEHPKGHQPSVDTHEETTTIYETESQNGDYIGDDQSEVGISHGDTGIYPREFFVWSGPADGMGFAEEVEMYHNNRPNLPKVYYAKDGSISPCEMTLAEGYSLDRIKVYGTDMTEIPTPVYDGAFSYEGFLHELPVGRYHICLRVGYRENGNAVSGSDYAFTVIVVETADDGRDPSETFEGTDIYVDGDFEPGVILLGLKEPYNGDIRDLFPEVSMAEVEDIYLTWYEQIKDLPNMDKQIENIKNRIGTDFVIILTDSTKEAVLAGIATMKDHPLVAYADPNHIVNMA